MTMFPIPPKPSHLSPVLSAIWNQLVGLLTKRPGVPAETVEKILELLAAISADAMQHEHDLAMRALAMAETIAREAHAEAQEAHAVAQEAFDLLQHLIGAVEQRAIHSLHVPGSALARIPHASIPDVEPTIVPPSQLLLEELRMELKVRGRFRYALRSEQVGHRAYLALQEASTGVIYVLMVEGSTWEAARVVCYSATSIVAVTLEDEYAAAIRSARDGKALMRFQARRGERPRAIVDRLETLP